ncbi:hypothetical protein [Hyalangium gracile]|uniref:hypothetical protein n=1 Tax=Hyalangium gracile TaxID=394092 RepID=UPI001CCE500D|nr:hypothetical protein [Hyalangium gracile]
MSVAHSSPRSVFSTPPSRRALPPLPRVDVLSDADMGQLETSVSHAWDRRARYSTR